MKNKPVESVQKILRCPPVLATALLQAILLGLGGTAAFTALGAPIPMAIEPWLGMTIAVLSLVALFFCACAQAELLRRTLQDESHAGWMVAGIQRHWKTVLLTWGILLAVVFVLSAMMGLLALVFSAAVINFLAIVLATLALPILLCMLPVAVLEDVNPPEALLRCVSPSRCKRQYLPCLAGIAVLSAVAYCAGLLPQLGWGGWLVAGLVVLLLAGAENLWPWVVCQSTETIQDARETDEAVESATALPAEAQESLSEETDVTDTVLLPEKADAESARL